jgi:hypothetical protein
MHLSPSMNRLHQILLIVSTLVASWLGMQLVHETGHVLGAFATGGSVERVVLHPLTISRTDLVDNPHPLAVVWAGPMFGALAPLMFWGAAVALRRPSAFVWQFFAGFCLIANGAYLAFGSFEGIGDCGELLRHGAARWQLWLFGAVTIPTGLRLWHRQGKHFGLDADRKPVAGRVAYAVLVVALVLITVGFVVDGR